jgi:hypothetical protein
MSTPFIKPLTKNLPFFYLGLTSLAKKAKTLKNDDKHRPLRISKSGVASGGRLMNPAQPT